MKGQAACVTGELARDLSPRLVSATCLRDFLMYRSMRSSPRLVDVSFKEVVETKSPRFGLVSFKGRTGVVAYIQDDQIANIIQSLDESTFGATISAP